MPDNSKKLYVSSYSGTPNLGPANCAPKKPMTITSLNAEFCDSIDDIHKQIYNKFYYETTNI